MDCNCNIPSCVECFDRYAEAITELGYADKELYYEWQDLTTQTLIDDIVDDELPQAVLDEILKNPNVW